MKLFATYAQFFLCVLVHTSAEIMPAPFTRVLHISTPPLSGIKNILLFT
jgi:hypothetical protein